MITITTTTMTITKPNLKIASLFIFISVLLLPGFVFGGENLEEVCQLEKIEKRCENIEPAECRKLLEKCEKYYREESARVAQDINRTAQEKKTLENKIYTLNKKIKNLDYQIYQSNLIIKDLGLQIVDTKGSIGKTSLGIEESKEKLVNILQTIYEEDQKPIVEILLSEQDLSGFFDNLVALEILNSKNKDLLQDIKILKSNLEKQKQSLGEEKGGLEQTVEIRELQKAENAKLKNEQEYHWNLTEQEYQQQLKEKQEIEKKAAEIRARIFELVGVPKSPNFGEAYEMAKYVKGITGVRPAFLLAILWQESRIGQNVGQCYLKNPATGAGIGIRTGRSISGVMKPSRDVQPFLIITKELGRDPYKTPVSCPMSYGYGGAMGPAQFIPSTWMGYRDRLKKITGKPADPWDIKDAFLAAAVYLADCGAGNQTYNSEWAAAMIYFSGTSKRTRYNGYGFYGDSVMNKTKTYEENIKVLERAK